uniref:Uncharacterized protein n=1 Tax=Globisporangium ultimum (strain ATCC 200006 / CBS 805.95 / DAOM BR144) TaxID=431595 RepID=K3WMM3_GLOUD
MNGVKRYPPWLAKALKTKEHSERFWTQQQRQQQQEPPNSHTVQGPETSLSSSEQTHDSIWDAIACDDAAYVEAFVSQDPQRVFMRREKTYMTESGAGHTGTSARTGATMLHEASTHGALRVTQYLLSFAKANFLLETCTRLINSVDTCYSRTTPLLAACQSSKGLMTQRLEIVRLLVAAQADVDHQDAHGDNVLHWCARDSHVVLLRFFLIETEASVNAIFTENYKRDNPLDIAKRQLSRAPSMTTTTTLNLLHHVDHKYNNRTKMQVLERYQTAQQSGIDARESETLQQAEVNRQRAEDTHVASAAAAAPLNAMEWLNTKDGKAYVKKQLPDAMAAKPEDLKSTAAERVRGMYCREQEAAAKRAATEAFQDQATDEPARH